MKNTSKVFKIVLGASIAIVAFFGVSVAKASASTTVFNTNPLDYATALVSNYTTAPGCQTCWSPSVTMAPGQVVSMKLYYHNTGTVTATDTRVRMSPQITPVVNSKMLAAGVWSSNASLVIGYGTVTIPGTPQTITYIPGTAAWFPEHGPANAPQYFSPAQEAALFSASGVSIGDIAPDSTCPSTQTFCHQGSVVARFQIGNAVVNPTTYICSDNIDNDYDGLTDYPSDPGCTSATDNDETNVIVPPQAYVTATTQPATNITETFANINGTYATNQSQATTWFEWGTSQNLGNTTPTQTMFGNSGSFSAPLTGLSPNVRYFFRACADTNATAQSCGNIMQFMTSMQVNNAPTVVTISGNCNPTQNAFTAYGSFTSNGSNTTSTWFQYGTTYSLGTQVGNQTQYGSSGNFNTSIFNLQPNTTYYFQAVAQNQGGTSYGTILSCTTNGIIIPPTQTQPPVVTTVPASNIAQTSARLNGFLNTSGVASVAYPYADTWFEWGTTTSFGYTTQHQSTMSGATYSDFIQGLRPDTRYFFRAVAQNALGTSIGQTHFFSTSESGVGPQVIYVNTNTGSGPVVMLKIDSDFASVCVNDTARYTVTYQNLTRRTLKDVVVQVILPKEETFLRSSRGSYADAANTITVLVGDLTGREKGTFEIESTINSRSKSSDTLVTTATLVYTQQGNRVQGDAIAYSLVNVGNCGNNGLAGLAIFGEGSCIFWIIILLIILIAVLLTRRNYKY